MAEDRAETAQNTDATSAAADSNQQVQPPAETVESLRESLAKTQAALKAANKEAESRRRRLEELDAKEAAAAEANKTEAQKLQDAITKANAERDAALARAQEQAIRSSVIAEASKLNPFDAADVLLHIDKSKLTVKDDGTVEGVGEQLEALVKSKPYLFQKSAASNLGATMPGHGQERGETREQKLKRMYGGVGDAPLGGGYVPIKE